MSALFTYRFYIDMYLHFSLVNIRECINRLYGKYMFNFIRNFQTVLLKAIPFGSYIILDF